jgi:predicted alpha/beta superfamily hydrolase
VLHTLFEHPQSFSTYLALSQSIWWNNRVLIKDLPAFEDRVAREHLAPNIYIGVGGLEQTVPKGVLPKSFTREAMARELRHACMVDNVRELATSLKAWGRAHGLTINSRVFDHQTHNSVPWVAIDPILDFALPRRSPQDGPK